MASPVDSLLQRFDHSSRLLLCTLMSGQWGAMAAFRTLQRSLSVEKEQHFNWQIFTEKLCSQEAVLEEPNKTLTMKPVLMLLPVLCQRNLFSLLLIVQSTVSKDCLRCLLQASRKDPNPDLWVQRLRDLLQAGMGERSILNPVLLSSTCQQQLKHLCQKIITHTSSNASLERKLNWFVKMEKPCLAPAGNTSQPGSQIRKKRKAPEESPDLEEENRRKRSQLEINWDTDVSQLQPERQDVATESTNNKLMLETFGSEGVPCLSSVTQFSFKDDEVEKRIVGQSSKDDTVVEVPSPMKNHILKLKELLEMQFELEDLCSLLKLSECPENELLQFCCWIVALSPELGYKKAAILSEKLFLPRVLLLIETASWPLTTALMMFCSKYPRPVCCTLISSIVQAPGQGLEQLRLVCKLIEECLEPECMRLVFSHIIKVPWTEDLLTVVHSLLERQVELPSELFNALVLNLCQMAQTFESSVHYAKLILTLLTKYQNDITLGHQHHLSCALDLNKTILKKSLQAALKRVTSR
ncbi:Fanconi anemia group E protein isoform X2 [Erythrolamprus reginae]|uniref:Fanconi anemia group E protein isoform X2 n=1 Tax=Erythrolamprus reginae TaxID=121349 RepID=UPI00396C622C